MYRVFEGEIGVMARPINRMDQGWTRIGPCSIRSMTNGAVCVEQRLAGDWRIATTPVFLLPRSRRPRCWAAKLVSRRWPPAPVSPTLNKPTAPESCPASRQPHNLDRYAGRFSSSHSHPYRYRSTVSLPKPVIMLGQVLLTAPHPQSVILAAAGIQSPLSQ